MYAMSAPIPPHHHQGSEAVPEKKKKKEEKDKEKHEKDKDKVESCLFNPQVQSKMWWLTYTCFLLFLAQEKDYNCIPSVL